VHSIPHATQTVVRAACLVGALESCEGLPAVLHHLGHERQVLERSTLVQGREDLPWASNAHELAQLEVGRGRRAIGCEGFEIGLHAHRCLLN
jgi:hypothetical protein